MKANVTFSLPGNALSIELVPENEGDRDFLALTMENMNKIELAARICSHAETEKEIDGVTFSLNVPREMKSVMYGEENPFPHPQKKFLC